MASACVTRALVGTLRPVVYAPLAGPLRLEDGALRPNVPTVSQRGPARVQLRPARGAVDTVNGTLAHAATQSLVVLLVYGVSLHQITF